MEIAYAYGSRLAEKSNNVRPSGLVSLVTGYPSHGFVIDRKEARKIFIDVAKPDGVLSELSTALRAQMTPSIDATTPKVAIATLALNLNGEANEGIPNAAAAAAGAAGGEPAIGGDGQAAANEPDAPAAGAVEAA